MRFPLIVALVFLSVFAAILFAPGPLVGARGEEVLAVPELRTRMADETPAHWRIRARADYGPPIPLGGEAETVPGRLMKQACMRLPARTWQVPAGARRGDLCTCVGRMMDRTPNAAGLDQMTNRLLEEARLPHPGASEMATRLITARISCQRGLFAALHPGRKAR